MIILIVLFLMFLGIVGGILVFSILSVTKRLKKTAYELLREKNPNPALLRRTIKDLSAVSMGKDIEAMELAKKLMDKRDLTTS